MITYIGRAFRFTNVALKASVSLQVRKIAYSLWCIACLGQFFLHGYALPATLGTFDAQKTPITEIPADDRDIGHIKRINFIHSQIENDSLRASKKSDKTLTPQGWEVYDGTPYSAHRGYGWLSDLRGKGRDRGVNGVVILPGGARTSVQELGRLTLANFQATHPDNGLLVFRIDLPNGWYRVSCASVDAFPLGGKPLVDQRSFKCRAHDAVFAGASHGAPLLVRGQELVEGSEVVEVTDGHLRIVVGDPAYAGWVWAHPGPVNKGWRRWWYDKSGYATGWYQLLTRTVDPGFHALSLNSLEIQRVVTAEKNSGLILRDFFNRDDNSDINISVPPDKHWIRRKLHPRVPDYMDVDLYATAVRFGAPKLALSIAGLLQQRASPATGIVRYSTRVSLFTGEGSQKHSGEQEAGIVLLADPANVSEFSSTFVGIRFVGRPMAARGSLVYRVGNGAKNYRTDVQIPDANLPFEITEGEYEIVVEHDVEKNLLRRVQINGADITDRLPLDARVQRLASGLFGVRCAINNTNPDVNLHQYYWYYRVEAVAGAGRAASSER